MFKIYFRIFSLFSAWVTHLFVQTVWLFGLFNSSLVISSKGKHGVGSWTIFFITTWVAIIGVESLRNVLFIFFYLGWTLSSRMVFNLLFFVVTKRLRSITESHIARMNFLLFRPRSILIRCWWVVCRLRSNTSECNIRVSILSFEDRFIFLKFKPICCTKDAAPIFSISEFDERSS